MGATRFNPDFRRMMDSLIREAREAEARKVRPAPVSPAHGRDARRAVRPTRRALDWRPIAGAAVLGAAYGAALALFAWGWALT